MKVVYHIIAFSIGIVLDLIVGDPYSLPHPIRWIGSLIAWLDKHLMDSLYEARSGQDTEKINNTKNWTAQREYTRGIVLVVVVISITVALTYRLISFSYWVHPIAGIVVEAILTFYCLAAKSLYKESMKVYYALKSGDTLKARKEVSMIVGRDTDSLNNEQIAKAAIETVAENTSDGVIAPLIYTCIGGPVAGLTYKAINTMDSMIGYHNDRYENFGRCAAKLDDVVNFIPARVSALAMVLAACIMKGYSGKNAFKIFKRDRFNHKSPNSAQTESACAGALNIKLAGDASYFGRIVSKPYIGDSGRAVEYEDIRRANRLMFVTYGIIAASCIMGMAIMCMMR